jgi:UDP-N-acetylglucosamine 1-carboxyvinyltransferase
VINGVEKLHQEKPFTIDSDRVEAVTYAVLGIASRGEITIGDISITYLKPFLDMIQEIGAGYEEVGKNKWKFYYKELKPVTVETSPHPGFLTDWQPFMAILLTQASGKSIIHERIFENRFSYVEELRRVGAKIEYIDYPIEDPKNHYFFNYDPEKKYSQTIQIHGPQELHGGVMTVADLRAGATLAIAALIAVGESYVTGIHHLERGYEDFVGKVTALGGNIRKI